MMGVSAGEYTTEGVPCSSCTLSKQYPEGSPRGEESSPVLLRLFSASKSRGDLVQRRFRFSGAEARP